MAKRLIVVSEGAQLGTSAISNIPFIAASGHDRLTLGMYQKPDITEQVAFQDLTVLSVLQKIHKKLKYMNNDLYVLKAERNENPKK